MFCPNCGNEIPDDSNFCGACGNNISKIVSGTELTEQQTVPMGATVISDAVSSAPAPKFVQFRKKSNKRKLISLVSVAAIAIVVIFGLKTVFFSGQENTYVYISDGKYELLTNIEKNTDIEIASGKNDTIKADFVSFSPDGRYIYYYTKYDSSTETASLCRAEYGKLKENANKNGKYIETIATNVCLGFHFMEDGSIIYQNGSGTLYHYNGSESSQIAKSVNKYYTDGLDRIVYVTDDYSEGHSLYGMKLSAIDDKVKLASNIDYVFSAIDFDNILYIRYEDDYSSTMYVVGFEKDSKKLGEGVKLLTVADGKTYFIAKSDSALNLYDYVEDDYVDVDANVSEPNKEDYVIPKYGYYTLNRNSNPSDYGEIYTSCTNAAAFYSSGWYHRSLEYASKNASKHRDVFKAFVDKYKSQEDENGFIVVTDAIKADLISLANTCGQGYQGEWMELCFYKKQNGTTYDYDAYNAARNDYYEAEKRIAMREVLKKKENSYPLRTLYCFEDGQLTVINENILNTEISYGGATTMLFNTSELIDGTIDITDVDSINSVTALFNIDYEAQNYLCAVADSVTYQMPESAAETCAAAYDEYWTNLHIADDKVYLGSDSEEAPLYVATITNGQIGDFTILDDNAEIQMFAGSTIYYTSEYYENNGLCYYDLYSYDGKESKRLAQDILYNNITFYRDGDILAYTGYRDPSGYELTLFDSEGERTIIGDNVTQFIRVDKKTLLYISDHDLYIYDGKSRRIIRSDVDWLWSLNSMEICHLLGGSDYSY